MSSERDLKWLRSCEFMAGIWSTCAKRQYFSVVIGVDGRVAGTGYNGAPPGVAHCIDGGCPRFNEGSAAGSVYDTCVAIHAEENALIWSDRSARIGGTLYVNGTPCWGCAKKIAGSGLAKLVYLRDISYLDWPRARGLLETANVVCVPYDVGDL